MELLSFGEELLDPFTLWCEIPDSPQTWHGTVFHRMDRDECLCPHVLAVTCPYHLSGSLSLGPQPGRLVKGALGASLPVLGLWSCCWGCPATCFTPALPFRRANALEEQLKEQELIACEKVLEEARRQRELLCRVEREKSIEVENLQARWVGLRLT